MTSPLPSYNEHAGCPKCGFLIVATKYQPSIDLTEPDGIIRPVEARFERQTRTCQRCTYQWDEACLDAKTVTQ